MPADASTETKVKAIKDRYEAILADLRSKAGGFGSVPGEGSIFDLLERMTEVAVGARASEMLLQRKVAELSAENESLRKSSIEKEEQYAALVQRFAADANNAQANFGALQDQMAQNVKEQVGMVQTRLAAAEQTSASLEGELKETKAQLGVATEKLGIAQSQLSKLVPAPDSEVAGFKPDGQIIAIDNKAGLVYINLGLADKVYRGLTFTVYDKGLPIPRDGKGKAEIKVLEPKERMSIAQIAVSNPRKPVLVDDTIANLVWDAGMTRVFVVAGDFDFNKDGTPDPDGPQKVKALIAKWGGKVTDTITPSTDFVVLGDEPKAAKPLDGDVIGGAPADSARQTYQTVLAQAKVFSLPVFNLERLLYMTGYEAMSPRGSAISGGER
jgi:hypothetical protein